MPSCICSPTPARSRCSSSAPLMDALNWIKPQVLFVRLHDARERGYRENVVTDDAERFVRFQRAVRRLAAA